MSVRLEWSTPQYTGVNIIPPGEEAYDGQTSTKPGDWILVIGSQAIEGQLGEFDDLVEQIQDALRRAPSLLERDES